MTNALAGHAVGYAPQHDAALMGSLTVRQALNATAALLVVDKAEQARRVEDALTAMGLQHCADQRYAPSALAPLSFSPTDRRTSLPTTASAPSGQSR